MQINSLAQLSLSRLKRAVAIRGKIEKLQTQLARLIGDNNSGKVRGSRAKTKRRRMSKAARAKISAAAKARWKAFRAKKAAK